MTRKGTSSIHAQAPPSSFFFSEFWGGLQNVSTACRFSSVCLSVQDLQRLPLQSSEGCLLPPSTCLVSSLLAPCPQSHDGCLPLCGQVLLQVSASPCLPLILPASLGLPPHPPECAHRRMRAGISASACLCLPGGPSFPSLFYFLTLLLMWPPRPHLCLHLAPLR